MEEEAIEHDQEAGKFFIRKDGEEASLDYRKEGKLLDFHSTFVPPKFRGQGIAARIVEKALDYAQENDFKVRPSCPYVAAYMDRFGKYEAIRAE